jgi:hypothetical protein
VALHGLAGSSRAAHRPLAAVPQLIGEFMHSPRFTTNAFLMLGGLLS